MSDEDSTHQPFQRLDASSNSGMGFLEPVDGSNRSEPTGITGFDYEQIFADLDGERPDHAEEIREAVTLAVGRLFRSLLFDASGALRDAESLGRQFQALGYAAGFTDATVEGIGSTWKTTKQSVSKRLREVRQRFGLNRSTMATTEARETFRRAQTGPKHWRRRKADEAPKAPQRGD